MPQWRRPSRGSVISADVSGVDMVQVPREPTFGAPSYEPPSVEGNAARALRPRFDADDFFGHQPTPTDRLPDPVPLLQNLTRCVIEILAGARELEQIARWVSDDVYRHLLKRVVLSTRARQAKNQAVSRPAFTIGSTTICEPRDGVVEAVVIVRGRARSRAVAVRLEGLDRRWRATAINVL